MLWAESGHWTNIEQMMKEYYKNKYPENDSTNNNSNSNNTNSTENKPDSNKSILPSTPTTPTLGHEKSPINPYTLQLPHDLERQYLENSYNNNAWVSRAIYAIIVITAIYSKSTFLFQIAMFSHFYAKVSRYPKLYSL